MNAFFRTLALLGILTVTARAQTTVDWDFSGGGGSGAPIPTLPPHVTGGTLAGFNEFQGPPANNPGFNSSNSSSGYPGASGNHNASIGIVTGPLDPATSTYFEFTLAPTVGYQLTAVSFDLGTFSTALGPQTLTLLASTDNFATFSSLWTAPVANDSRWHLGSSTGTWLGNFTAAPNTPITFRLYGSDGIGGDNNSNWRIDDVSLGLIATASPVPEPSTYLALLVGISLLGARKLRWGKSRIV